MFAAVSTAFLSAVNSEPNVLVCTLVWRLDFQCTGVEPTKANIPVTLLPVTKSCAWSASQKMVSGNSGIFGLGKCGSISSLKKPYW